MSRTIHSSARAWAPAQLVEIHTICMRACPSIRLSHHRPGSPNAGVFSSSSVPRSGRLPPEPVPFPAVSRVPSPSRLHLELLSGFWLLAGGSVAAILLLCVANSAESRQLEAHTAAARGAAIARSFNSLSIWGLWPLFDDHFSVPEKCCLYPKPTAMGVCEVKLSLIARFSWLYIS